MPGFAASLHAGKDIVCAGDSGIVVEVVTHGRQREQHSGEDQGRQRRSRWAAKPPAWLICESWRDPDPHAGSDHTPGGGRLDNLLLPASDDMSRSCTSHALSSMVRACAQLVRCVARSWCLPRQSPCLRPARPPTPFVWQRKRPARSPGSSPSSALTGSTGRLVSPSRSWSWRPRRRARSRCRGGSADLIVSDWLWVTRERGLGAALVFYPYSSALGAVMVPGSVAGLPAWPSSRAGSSPWGRGDRQELAPAAGRGQAGEAST